MAGRQSQEQAKGGDSCGQAHIFDQQASEAQIPRDAKRQRVPTEPEVLSFGGLEASHAVSLCQEWEWHAPQLTHPLRELASLLAKSVSKRAICLTAVTAVTAGVSRASRHVPPVQNKPRYLVYSRLPAACGLTLH